MHYNTLYYYRVSVIKFYISLLRILQIKYIDRLTHLKVFIIIIINRVLQYSGSKTKWALVNDFKGYTVLYARL